MSLLRSSVFLATSLVAFAAFAAPRVPRVGFEAPGHDNGTYLMADLAVGEVTCDTADSATVQLGASLVTSGSVDSAEVMLSVDGGEAVQIGVIEPQDFVHDGRMKTADWSGEISLGNGDHQVVLCFVQSGAKGRTPKQTCGLVDVSVDCAPSPICEQDKMFFGNIANSPQICGGKGTPHIPVHYRGAQYDEVTLVIEGPDGFGLTMAMRHAGASCIHHALWDTRGGNHAGPGDYTFSAYVGDALQAAITRPLLCD